jgi:lysophospholipase L1-like esterase
LRRGTARNPGSSFRAQAPKGAAMVGRLSVYLLLGLSIAGETSYAADDCDPISILVATTPAPPRMDATWRRHASISTIPANTDVVVIGDSITQAWPSDLTQSLFPGRAMANLGVFGDHTQHVLWRLEHLKLQNAKPGQALLMIGTNNLTAQNQPCGTAAGIMSVVKKISAVWPGISISVISIPPFQGKASVLNSPRLVVNSDVKMRLASPAGAIRFIDIEGLSLQEEAFQSDGMHLSRLGYERMTSILANELRR